MAMTIPTTTTMRLVLQAPTVCLLLSCTTFIYPVSVHTQNETMVAGSAFAISYTSDLSAVTDEDLVVFTVLEQFVFLVPSCLCFRLSVVWQYPVEANGDFQGS